MPAAAGPLPQALLGRPWPAPAARCPDPDAVSNGRGVRARALRMGTGREEEHGLGPSRGAARDPPARGLAGWGSAAEAGRPVRGDGAGPGKHQAGARQPIGASGPAPPDLRSPPL